MAYRSTPVTEARKEARRQSILQAATHMFGQHGYHAATVPMIVAAAESSVGGFYLYYRNKEDVFAAVLEEVGRQLAAAIAEAKSARPAEEGQIECCMEALFLFLAAHPREARILTVESSGLSPRLEQVRRSLLARHIEEARQTLLASPELYEAADTEIAAQCLVGGVFEAIINWMEQEASTRRPAVEIARLVAGFYTRAVCRQEKNNPR